METVRRIISTVSCLLLPLLSHDVTGMSHDVTGISHDVIGMSHGIAGTKGMPHDVTSAPKLDHFRFRSRHVGGRNVAVVSLRLDPERGRRSILPESGDSLSALLPLLPRHPRHRFLPPFHVEETLPLNASLTWGSLQPGEGEGETDEGAPRKGKRRRKNNRKEGERRKSKNKKKKKKKDKKEHRIKMHGDEACQFRVLKKCARKVRLIPKKNLLSLSDTDKCQRRREFLGCVERKRDQSFCRARSVARGDMPSLRAWIKKLFWTSSSCLLKESMKGA